MLLIKTFNPLIDNIVIQCNCGQPSTKKPQNIHFSKPSLRERRLKKVIATITVSSEIPRTLCHSWTPKLYSGL